MQTKIAMISYHTCPLASLEGKETGGMNIYVLELSKALAKSGQTVDIYTRCQDPHNPRIVQIAPGLRLMHLPAGPQKYLSKKKLTPYMKEFIKNYHYFVKNENLRYDILHCHYYLSGLIGLSIKKHSPNISLIMSFHTLALMKNLVARSTEEKENKLRVAKEFLLTKKSEKIITSSETEFFYMQYLYNSPVEKLVVVPPGINTDLFHPIDKTISKRKIHIPLNEKIVLFVGRIEPLKGVDSLIYAMKIIEVRNPHLKVCLMIVGGDVSQHKQLWTKELQKLEDLRKILHIPNIVKFVGQRTQEELPYYYNSAEVLVMPSHYESFGIAALEAMACGIPVITSNVSGITSIMDEKHKNLITTVNNPLLLATQIEHLLTDGKAHEKISKNIINSVSDLTWENTATRISEVYSQTIHKH